MSDNDLIRRGDAFAVVKGLSLLEGDILALPAVTAPDRDTFDAMCAMRNAINEYVPMPSLESDLLRGPENSVFCAVVAEAVITEIKRLRAVTVPQGVDALQAAGRHMLALHDGFLSGADVDIAAAKRLHLAASFGAQAFAVCPIPDARPAAMMRAIALALIDLMHPNLDYLRMVNMARPVEAPYMTDLMVDPESIDAFVEANPLPPSAVDDSQTPDPAVKPAPDVAGLDDGRPCPTDVFLVAAMEQLDDKWDFFEAVKDWCEGDWDGALTGIELPAPAQPALTPKPVDDSLAADSAVKEWNAAIRAAAAKCGKLAYDKNLDGEWDKMEAAADLRDAILALLKDEK